MKPPRDPTDEPKVIPIWLAPVFIMAKGLRSVDYRVYGYLGLRAGKKRVCWPSVRTIAGDLGVSVGTVVGAIARLEKASLIRTEPDPSRKTSTRYHLLRFDEPVVFAERRKKNAGSVQTCVNTEADQEMNTGVHEIGGSVQKSGGQCSAGCEHNYIRTGFRESDQENDVTPLPQDRIRPADTNAMNDSGGKEAGHQEPSRPKKSSLKLGRKIVAEIDNRVCQLNPPLSRSQYFRSKSLWSALTRHVGAVPFDVAINWPNDFSPAELASWDAIHAAIWQRIQTFKENAL